MSYSQSDFNAAKANFDNVYVGATPVPYMERMSSVGYEIPQNARNIFESIYRELEIIRGRPLNVLDIGSSYGVNAALLRYKINLNDLYSHYLRNIDLRSRPALLLEADAKYFRGLQKRLGGYFIGLDASENAISYAKANGLLDHGLVMNLEEDSSAMSHVGTLDVDLIISTGTIGYIGPLALSRALSLCRQPDKVWVASFVLRLIDFGPYMDALASRGMGTESLPDLFAQRRMADHDELQRTAKFASDQDMHIQGVESTGKLFSRFFLSRPNKVPGSIFESSLSEILYGRTAHGDLTSSGIPRAENSPNIARTTD